MHEPNVAVDYTENLFRLDGKVAVVVGGGSGLGEAIAHGFALAGAITIVADVNADAAETVAASGRQRGLQMTGAHIDVTDAKSVDALAADMADRFERVDVLVNSAGTSERHPAEDFPEDVWDRIIAINLKGTFLACQAFGRLMLAQGSGSIINLASIGASIAYPHTTAYLQSKGGVAQMTRSLALEWIDRGVRVNAIAPSLFDTPLVRASDAKASLTSTWITERTPIGRRGAPHEVVGPAIFLATAASSMVTGHLLQVDGGYLIA